MSRTLAIVAMAVLCAVGTPLSASGASPCSTDGVRSVVVRISEPANGATVSGPVTVQGWATSVSQIRRVELTVDDQLVSVLDADGREAPFSFVWDSTKHGVGNATLRVLACGGEGPGAWGASSIDTDVAPVVGQPIANEAKSVPKPKVTTPSDSAAPSVAPAAAATSGPAAAADEVAKTAAPAAKKPKAPALTSRPLALWSRLGESAEPRSAAAPVWVGVVVGIAGLSGLVYAIAGQSRRRGRGAADEVVAVEAPPETPGDTGPVPRVRAKRSR
jgi:hypothetical protein